MSVRTLLFSTSFLCGLVLFSLTILSSDSNFVEAKGTLCPLILRKLLGDEKSCEKVTCQTSLNTKSCGKETNLDKRTEYVENVVMCGCCPACVRRIELKEDEECGEAKYEDCEEKVCPVLIGQCGAGLGCDPETKTCVRLDVSPEDLTCAQKRAISKSSNWTHWTPTCNDDGSYAPVQCKGMKNNDDAMCFCVDRTGDRIFGRRRWTDALKNMTCACSVHAHQLRSQKGLISTLHCTLDGSYEPLQCDSDSGLCYCVDRVTGEMTGAVVSEKQWKNLPCYIPGDHGVSYLRRCESKWTAQERIKREASLHGIELGLYSNIECDYDGSYKRFQRTGNTEECVFKNGLRIGSYYREYTKAEPMTCNCARDPTDYDLEGLVYNARRTCVPQGQPGDFENVQSEGSSGVCVDKDGFIYYRVPIDNQCCLYPTDDGCPIEVYKECFVDNDPTKERRYHKCVDILH